MKPLKYIALSTGCLTLSYLTLASWGAANIMASEPDSVKTKHHVTQWDAPLQAALSADQYNADIYSYFMDYESDEFSGKAFIDPSRAEGERVRLLFPDMATVNAETREEIANIDKEGLDHIWCHNFSDIIPGNARLLTRTDETSTYIFAPLAEDDEDADIYRHLTGYVTIDSKVPGILSVRMEAKKPFKPVIFGKISSLIIDVSCESAPDGRRYMSKMHTMVEGRMMMQSFTQMEEQRIYGLKRLSPVAPASSPNL